jgi:hypothetical protein
MILSVMQPYFFPYIGYFHLIHASNLFIVYDNIQYTKKGWINRNRFLQNGKDLLFSIPLKKDSDFLDVRDRELASDFNRSKLLNQLKAAYRRAPFFEETFPLIEEVINFNDLNLFRFIHNSIVKVCDRLKIDTTIGISSSFQIDNSLKKQDKVLALCKEADANVYINTIGGMELYSKEGFQAKGVDLKFIKSKPFKYKQFENEFIPGLSIIDVMMFNSLDVISKRLISGFELIEKQ